MEDIRCRMQQTLQIYLSRAGSELCAIRGPKGGVQIDRWPHVQLLPTAHAVQTKCWLLSDFAEETSDSEHGGR